MNKLKARLKKQGGFTLVEMLIVIGIIGVLVAVSIPAVNNALEGARHAADAANERAAKAVMLIEYVNGNVLPPPAGSLATSTVMYYDAQSGTLKTQGMGLSGHLISNPIAAYGKHNQHRHIRVELMKDATVKLSWCSTADNVMSGGLCSEAAVDAAH